MFGYKGGPVDSWNSPGMENRMSIRRFALACVLTLVAGASASAQDFEVDFVFFRGDPKGSPEAGTLHLCAAPTLVTKSGQEADLLVGGHILVGKQMVPVGRRVSLTLTDVKNGAIAVKAAFEHSEAIGAVGAQQVTITRADKTTTVQSGGRVRLELGSDPKDRHWVELTVRKLK
jgi:hypothetical protein